MDRFDATVVRSSESVLAKNKVLRNTYMLLSLTVLFSAFCAGTTLVMGLAGPGPLFSIIGTFGLLFLTMWLRNSSMGIVSVFAFTGFVGYTLGPILNMTITGFANGGQIVTMSAAATGVIFLSLSAYAITTKKDFNYLGGFLFVALIAIILASIANIFLAMPAMQLGIACISALVFSGFILYDTSRIINGGETNYIMATISLYLDILNLFLSLLQILSALSGRN